MIFKYKEILRSKYKDINLSRWNVAISHSQKVNTETSVEQKVIEKNRGIKRQQNLNKENQQYLEKRLRIDSSV